ncbi:hypothetical protein QX249_24555 [Vibrio parahaemolyticus]|uniref:Uncharacterized protein n=1 Tax=Vibrio parahaemolyticus TaxID=670 RepID=A0AAW8Q6C6_VIBPH|nr:hypothetical protein [Vibrio parahaemolyticus]MDS1823816.1 hypothetical protein [Vibrio parahaemolyticus]
MSDKSNKKLNVQVTFATQPSKESNVLDEVSELLSSIDVPETEGDGASNYQIPENVVKDDEVPKDGGNTPQKPEKNSSKNQNEKKVEEVSKDKNIDAPNSELTPKPKKEIEATREPSRLPIALSVMAVCWSIGLGGAALYFAMNGQDHGQNAQLRQQVSDVYAQYNDVQQQLSDAKVKINEVLIRNGELTSLLAEATLEAQEKEQNFVSKDALTELKERVDSLDVIEDGFSAVLDRVSELEVQTDNRITEFFQLAEAQIKLGLSNQSKSTNKWVIEQLDKRGDLMIKQIGHVVAEVKIDSERQQREIIVLKTKLEQLKELSFAVKEVRSEVNELKKDVDAESLKAMSYKVESLLKKVETLSGI